VNYRTTEEIRKTAVALLEGCTVDDLDGGEDTQKGYRSLTHGNSPSTTTSPRTRTGPAILACENGHGERTPAASICVVARFQ